MKICITLKVCCIIAFIFFAIPFIINFLGCIHAPFQSWSEPSKWTMFWGQYISGFAAFAMLYVAWRTLLTTKETNRPYVIIDIVERCSIAYIRCRNIGHTTAQNIKLSFKMEQISEIAISEVKECFKSINSSSPFVLEPMVRVYGKSFVSLLIGWIVYPIDQWKLRELTNLRGKEYQKKIGLIMRRVSSLEI